MKQTFFKFIPYGKTPLPKFSSRRFGTGSNFTHAYKSEGGDPDEDLEAIKKEFNTFKSKVEGDVTTKATAAATEAIKNYELRIKELEKLKGLPEGVTAETLKKMADDIAKTIADFDEFQLKASDFKPAPVVKSFGSVLKAAVEEKTDEFAKMARGDKSVKSINIEMQLKDVGDMSTANVTGSTIWGAQSRAGIIEAPKRKVHMREVMVGGTVGAGTDYYFMKQNGVGEGVAAFTAEGATKPQVDEDLVESSVKIESLPAFARVTKKAMNNIPGFISFLQSRLTERIYKAEDAAILYGDGLSPNLKGILTAGNFVDSDSVATKLIERIVDDISKLEDTYERSANLILLRPKDYMSFFKNKADGSGEYDLPKNVFFVNGVLYVGMIPVKATTALIQGDFITGDFEQGAQFLTQESLRIEFFEQDADNVTKNKVTVRAEETVCLPVFGNDYFIKGAVPGA